MLLIDFKCIAIVFFLLQSIISLVPHNVWYFGQFTGELWVTKFSNFAQLHYIQCFIAQMCFALAKIAFSSRMCSTNSFLSMHVKIELQKTPSYIVNDFLFLWGTGVKVCYLSIKIKVALELLFTSTLSNARKHVTFWRVFKMCFPFL